MRKGIKLTFFILISQYLYTINYYKIYFENSDKKIYYFIRFYYISSSFSSILFSNLAIYWNNFLLKLISSNGFGNITVIIITVYKKNITIRTNITQFYAIQIFHNSCFCIF